MTSTNQPYVFEQGNGYSVISLTPELNDAQWSDIEKVGSDLLDQLKDHKSPAFVVDLSSLNYMGSAMVALIVRLWKSVKDEKGRMIVVNREKLVFEVLELAGLHKIWVIVETREEALRKLGVRASAASTSTTSSGLASPTEENKMAPAFVVLATLGAIGGLIWLYNAADPKIPLVLTLVAAVVAIIFGTLSATSLQKNIKALGLAGVVANLVFIVVAILKI
ncbi:MAG: STAS domain-containing protein [Planctomycetaceae bacterium]|nr:STAS domain-containing protein [Planctomycetaceae bacterium]